MKKLEILFGIACVAVIITFIVVFYRLEKVPPPPPPPLPQRGISLNDIVSGLADEMVLNFKNDQVCKENKIAFWLDKTWVDNVYSIIYKEHGDGIRLYFAKDNNKKDSLVIVSTFTARPDTAESGYDHEDYYDHTDSFFSTQDALLTRTAPTDPGALLFAPYCPCAKYSGFIIIPGKRGDNTISCKNAYKAVSNLKLGDTINTYSEWFPLSWLLAEKLDLDNQTTMNPKEPGNGIRIYFAKHDKKTTLNPRHQGRAAFIIVTTKLANKDTVDYFSPESDVKTFTNAASDNGEQCQYNCTGVTLPQ